MSASQTIRCVAFDFDGTLVDSNAIKRRAFLDATAALDPSGRLVRQAIADRPDDDRHGVMRRVAERAVELGLLPSDAVADSAERLVGAYAAVVEAGQATLPERRGASGALGALGARLPLYLNSATPADSLRRAVARRGWIGHFRDVLGRPSGKADNLRAISARERLVGSELLMVGDEQRDFEAATEAGCRFIGIASDGNDFTASVALLTDLVALPAAIEALPPC